MADPWVDRVNGDQARLFRLVHEMREVQAARAVEFEEARRSSRQQQRASELNAQGIVRNASGLQSIAVRVRGLESSWTTKVAADETEALYRRQAWAQYEDRVTALEAKTAAHDARWAKVGALAAAAAVLLEQVARYLFE